MQRTMLQSRPSLGRSTPLPSRPVPRGMHCALIRKAARQPDEVTPAPESFAGVMGALALLLAAGPVYAADLSSLLEKRYSDVKGEPVVIASPKRIRVPVAEPPKVAPAVPAAVTSTPAPVAPKTVAPALPPPPPPAPEPIAAPKAAVAVPLKKAPATTGAAASSVSTPVLGGVAAVVVAALGALGLNPNKKKAEAESAPVGTKITRAASSKVITKAVPVGSKFTGSSAAGSRVVSKAPAGTKITSKTAVVTKAPPPPPKKAPLKPATTKVVKAPLTPATAKIVKAPAPVKKAPVGTKIVGTKITGKPQPVGTKIVGKPPVGTKIVGKPPVGKPPVGTKVVGTKVVGTKVFGPKGVGTKITRAAAAAPSKSVEENESFQLGGIAGLLGLALLLAVGITVNTKPTPSKAPAPVLSDTEKELVAQLTVPKKTVAPALEAPKVAAVAPSDVIIKPVHEPKPPPTPGQPSGQPITAASTPPPPSIVIPPVDGDNPNSPNPRGAIPPPAPLPGSPSIASAPSPSPSSVGIPQPPSRDPSRPSPPVAGPSPTTFADLIQSASTPAPAPVTAAPAAVTPTSPPINAPASPEPKPVPSNGRSPFQPDSAQPQNTGDATSSDATVLIAGSGDATSSNATLLIGGSVVLLIAAAVYASSQGSSDTAATATTGAAAAPAAVVTPASTLTLTEEDKNKLREVYRRMFKNENFRKLWHAILVSSGLIIEEEQFEQQLLDGPLFDQLLPAILKELPAEKVSALLQLKEDDSMASLESYLSAVKVDEAAVAQAAKEVSEEVKQAFSNPEPAK